MDTKRELVFALIDLERKLQDANHGTIAEHGHTVGEWLLIMEKKINDAKHQWYVSGNESAIKEILEVSATGVACLEQHKIGT